MHEHDGCPVIMRISKKISTFTLSLNSKYLHRMNLGEGLLLPQASDISTIDPFVECEEVIVDAVKNEEEEEEEELLSSKKQSKKSIHAEEEELTSQMPSKAHKTKAGKKRPSAAAKSGGKKSGGSGGGKVSKVQLQKAIQAVLKAKFGGGGKNKKKQ